MKIHASGEDYLEAVLILQKKQGMVRSIDLARHMGFSKPSISHAVGVLREFFTEQFIAAGVDPEIAERDACRIEHAISQDTFEKIRDAHKQEK